MSHDEHIAGEDGGVDLGAADVDDQVGKETAYGGVEQGASQTAHGEVVGDQLGGVFWH